MAELEFEVMGPKGADVQGILDSLVDYCGGSASDQWESSWGKDGHVTAARIYDCERLPDQEQLERTAGIGTGIGITVEYEDRDVSQRWKEFHFQGTSWKYEPQFDPPLTSNVFQKLQEQQAYLTQPGDYLKRAIDQAREALSEVRQDLHEENRFERSRRIADLAEGQKVTPETVAALIEARTQMEASLDAIPYILTPNLWDQTMRQAVSLAVLSDACEKSLGLPGALSPEGLVKQTTDGRWAVPVYAGENHVSGTHRVTREALMGSETDILIFNADRHFQATKYAKQASEQYASDLAKHGLGLGPIPNDGKGLYGWPLAPEKTTTLGIRTVDSLLANPQLENTQVWKDLNEIAQAFYAEAEKGGEAPPFLLQGIRATNMAMNRVVDQGSQGMDARRLIELCYEEPNKSPRHDKLVGQKVSSLVSYAYSQAPDTRAFNLQRLETIRDNEHLLPQEVSRRFEEANDQEPDKMSIGRWGVLDVMARIDRDQHRDMESPTKREAGNEY